LFFLRAVKAQGTAGLGEMLALKEQNPEHAGGDGSIGDVEHRLKEGKGPSPEKPGRVMALPDGEVKHVHHFAIKQRGITAAGRKKLGDGTVHAAVRKQRTVKDRVDDVAHSAGKDQAYAQEQAHRRIAARQGQQVIADERNRHDAEQTEEQLAVAPAEFDAEGHAFVLGEVYAELLRAKKHVAGFENVVGLNVEFETLIEEEYPQNGEECYPGLCLQLIAVPFWPRCSGWHGAPYAGAPWR
jgi:hypothetical protein